MTSRKVVRKFLEFEPTLLTTYKTTSIPPKDYEVSKERSIARPWNNLRLLVDDVRFLNAYWGDNVIHTPTIVYLNPSEQVYNFIRLFPGCKYHLYGGPFDERIKSLEGPQYEGIVLHESNFNESDIEFWKEYQNENLNVYLICNLYDPKNRDLNIQNLEFQKRLVQEIAPTKTLLRVQFPSEGMFEYFDGVAFRQSFSRTDELGFTLIPSGSDTMRTWNCEELRESIVYHNSVIRENLLVDYIIPDSVPREQYIDRSLGLVRNYDGLILLYTLNDYLLKFKPFSGSSRVPSFDDLLNVCAFVFENMSITGKNPIRPITA